MAVSPDAERPISITDEITRLSAESPNPAPGRLLHRHIDTDRQVAVLRSVFLDSDPRWWAPFTVMLVLSAGIATLGLSQNSAATVIGAMIIAPLGAPIIALGGSLAAAWPRESVRMSGVIAIGATAVVGIAVLLGFLLPNATPNAQILARTSPDLRDLGVALLAGAAGAYAYTKSSLSSTLVGVAIAVALVPPLATVGLTVEEHRWTLAGGALTLFATNLVGITVAASVVMLSTGFVPVPRLRDRSIGVVVGVGAAVIAAVAITVPLAVAYAKVKTATGQQTEIYRQVGSTLGVGNTATHVVKIDVSGNEVVIDLSDPAAAPGPADFEADLRDEVGPDVSVTVK
jgi:uncharacterized hydrophobic protein (TIGR00271 family)